MVLELPLYLNEQDVEKLLTMDDALDALESAFRWQAEGRLYNPPRRRVKFAGMTPPSTMSVAIPPAGVVGIKAAASGTRGTRSVVLLWDHDTGELLAVMEADWLSQVRTGAGSGIATRCLARGDARTVGIFGTGHQAPAQLAAIAAVRPVTRVLALGRDKDRLHTFCRRMSSQLDIVVQPASAPQELVEQSDIIITITNAREPLFDGRWLQAGTHINAGGSNVWMNREVDDTTVSRSALVVVDDREQAKIEAGDLRRPIECGDLSWSDVWELGDVVTGRAKRASADEITFFSSQGVALEDVAVGIGVYRRALAMGAGLQV